MAIHTTISPFRGQESGHKNDISCRGHVYVLKKQNHSMKNNFTLQRPDPPSMLTCIFVYFST